MFNDFPDSGFTVRRFEIRIGVIFSRVFSPDVVVAFTIGDAQW